MLEKEMNLLLNNFWITKEENPDDYYFLKKNYPQIREFVNKNLGANLILHDRFIKLEKKPAIASSIYGIKEFENPMDYVILFIMLLFLEDKIRGDKFVLSTVTEYVKNTAITLELKHIPDWDITAHRKSLVRVIKTLCDVYHVIDIKDYSKDFAEDKNADALYEAKGISNYIVPSFDYDIFSLNKEEEFLKLEWGNQSDEKGDIRRYKIYRDLLYMPHINNDKLTLNEIDYLKKMRRNIEKEIKENMNYEVEITKTDSLIYASDEMKVIKFPDNKRLSDIILLLNTEIMNYINRYKLKVDEYERYIIYFNEFIELIENFKLNYKEYFTKQILDLTTTKYQDLIINTLLSYGFIEVNNEQVIIYPVVYHYEGIAYKCKNKEDNTLQLDLFGGEENESH